MSAFAACVACASGSSPAGEFGYTGDVTASTIEATAVAEEPDDDCDLVSEVRRDVLSVAVLLDLRLDLDGE
jgi:hypothetical protein